MKYIKIFERKKKIKQPMIDLVGYPEGNIISVTQEEFDELKDTDFDISWDDDIDYYHGQTDGQWRFMNEEEEELEKWLNLLRNIGSNAIVDIKKFNL